MQIVLQYHFSATIPRVTFTFDSNILKVWFYSLLPCFSPTNAVVQCNHVFANCTKLNVHHLTVQFINCTIKYLVLLPCSCHGNLSFFSNSPYFFSTWHAHHSIIEILNDAPGARNIRWSFNSERRLSIKWARRPPRWASVSFCSFLLRACAGLSVASLLAVMTYRKQTVNNWGNALGKVQTTAIDGLLCSVVNCLL